MSNDAFINSDFDLDSVLDDLWNESKHDGIFHDFDDLPRGETPCDEIFHGDDVWNQAPIITEPEQEENSVTFNIDALRYIQMYNSLNISLVSTSARKLNHKDNQCAIFCFVLEEIKIIGDMMFCLLQLKAYNMDTEDIKHGFKLCKERYNKLTFYIMCKSLEF